MVMARSFAGLPPVAILLALVVGGASGVAVILDSPLVSPALLAAIGIVALTLRYSLAGVIVFVLIACLLPFAVLPARVVLAPTFVDLTLTAILIAWLARLLRHREDLIRTGADLPVLLFLVVAFLAFLLGTTNSSASSEDVRLFLKTINSALLFFGVTQIVRSENDLASATRAMIIGGGAAAVLALWLYVLPEEAALAILSGLGPLGYPTADILRPLAGTDTLRATGTSVDPNVLGALLMIAGVLAVAQVVARRPVLPRFWLVALGIPILAALSLTYSRSAWVGVAAAVGFLAVFRERKALALVAMGAAALVALPQGRTVLTRLQSAFEGSDRASMMRLDEYRNALEIIERYPVLGIGFGGPPDVDLTPGVSSLYLLIAEQMGLVGLACFLAAVGAALWTSFRAMAVPVGRGLALRRDRWDLPSRAVVRSTGPPYRTKGRDDGSRVNPDLPTRIGGIPGPVPASGHGSQFSPGSSPEALPGMLSGFQAALLAALIAGAFDQYFASIRFPHMVALFWLLVALLLVAARLSSQQSAEPSAREAQ